MQTNHQAYFNKALLLYAEGVMLHEYIFEAEIQKKLKIGLGLGLRVSPTNVGIIVRAQDVPTVGLDADVRPDLVQVLWAVPPGNLS